MIGKISISYLMFLLNKLENLMLISSGNIGKAYIFIFSWAQNMKLSGSYRVIARLLKLSWRVSM